MVQDNSTGDRPVMGDRSNASDISVSVPTALHFESTIALSSPQGSAGKIDSSSIAQSAQFLQPMQIDNGSRTNDRVTSPATVALEAKPEVKPVAPGSLDVGKSLTELAQAGLIVDRRAESQKQSESASTVATDGAIAPAEPIGPVERVSFNESHVKVLDESAERRFVLAEPSSSSKVNPDIVIKQDGKIEVLRDNRQPPLTIQLEAGKEGEANAAQMQAAKEFDSWIKGRKEILARQDAELAAKQEEAMKAAEAESAQNVQNAMNRFQAPGSMSRQEADEYFPPQDQSPQAEQEATQQPAIQMLMDAIAALSGANKEHPYETLRRTPENGFAIGRYGLSSEIFMDWLSGMPEFSKILGNPPDFSKLHLLMAALAKGGKLPQGFADKFQDPKFAGEFVNFLAQMKSGQGTLNARDIEKFFPKEMQESVIKGVLSSASEKGISAGQMALAMHLGKPVSQLKEADLKDAKNQEFMAASMKMMGLSAARHQAGKDDRIDWEQASGPSTPLAFKIAKAAEANAKNNNTVGWCYREVADTLDKFGVHLYGNSAYMAAPQLANNKHFKEVSTKDLKPGTVLVFGKSEGHPHGHITVYLGNGQEASDHVQPLVNFNAYGGARAFQPIA